MITNENLKVVENLTRDQLPINTSHVFKLIFNDKTFDFEVSRYGRIDGIALCNASEKTYMDWKRRAATKKFMKDQNILKESFETVRTSGCKKGAFLCERLALNIGEWISEDVHKQLKRFYDEHDFEEENQEEPKEEPKEEVIIDTNNKIVDYKLKLANDEDFLLPIRTDCYLIM